MINHSSGIATVLGRLNQIYFNMLKVMRFIKLLIKKLVNLLVEQFLAYFFL